MKKRIGYLTFITAVLLGFCTVCYAYYQQSKAPCIEKGLSSTQTITSNETLWESLTRQIGGVVNFARP